MISSKQNNFLLQSVSSNKKIEIKIFRLYLTYCVSHIMAAATTMEQRTHNGFLKHTRSKQNITIHYPNNLGSIVDKLCEKTFPEEHPLHQFRHLYSDNISCLGLAITCNDLEAVTHLIEWSPELLNEKIQVKDTALTITPLSIAIMQQNSKMVSMMLQHDTINVDKKSIRPDFINYVEPSFHNGRNVEFHPLDIASYVNNLEIFTMLLEHVETTDQPPVGKFPKLNADTFMGMMLSAGAHTADSICAYIENNILPKAGMDCPWYTTTLDGRPSYRVTLFEYLLYHHNHRLDTVLLTLLMLLDNGASFDNTYVHHYDSVISPRERLTDKLPIPLLFKVIGNWDLTPISIMLFNHNNIKVDIVDPTTEMTLLMTLVKYNKIEHVRAVLKKLDKEHIDYVSNMGVTSLDLRLQRWRPERCAVEIAIGHKCCAVDIAIDYGHCETLELLIEYGATIPKNSIMRLFRKEASLRMLNSSGKLLNILTAPSKTPATGLKVAQRNFKLSRYIMSDVLTYIEEPHIDPNGVVDFKWKHAFNATPLGIALHTDKPIKLVVSLLELPNIKLPETLHELVISYLERSKGRLLFRTYLRRVLELNVPVGMFTTNYSRWSYTMLNDPMDRPRGFVFSLLIYAIQHDILADVQNYVTSYELLEHAVPAYVYRLRVAISERRWEIVDMLTNYSYFDDIMSKNPVELEWVFNTSLSSDNDHLIELLFVSLQKYCKQIVSKELYQNAISESINTKDSDKRILLYKIIAHLKSLCASNRK